MATIQPYKLKTISEFHQLRNLPKPQHPLFSVINFEAIKRMQDDEKKNLVQDFYSIALKRMVNGRMKYGQQEYDFDEGIMFFIAPGQVYSIEAGADFQHVGWLILIHPDFLWNTPLAKTIKQYEYFSYSVNEALFLSDKEEATINGIVQNMEQEYHANIDTFSQDVIIAQLELLLTYAKRFYHRQFITRKITNHKTLDRLETILEEYFNSDTSEKKGVPTVQYIAEALNVSPNYLSGLLKVLTRRTSRCPPNPATGIRETGVCIFGHSCS